MNQNLQSKSKKCQKWIEVNTYNIAILKNHTNLHTLLPSIVNYFAQIFIMTITCLFWLKLVIRLWLIVINFLTDSYWLIADDVYNKVLKVKNFVLWTIDVLGWPEFK